MTNTDGLTTAQLADLADRLRCPDGMRTPFNSDPLPKTRRALIAMIAGMEQREADGPAIERAGRC
jgi:hypothetical protein